MGDPLEEFLSKICAKPETGDAEHQRKTPAGAGLLAMLHQSIPGVDRHENPGAATGILMRHSATPPSERWHGSTAEATSHNADEKDGSGLRLGEATDGMFQEDIEEESRKNDSEKIAVEIVGGIVDLDQLTSIPIEVSPIARYASEHYPGQRGKRIVVSNNFIAYALKFGHIRVLEITTGEKHLLKAHKQQVVDLCFFNDEVDRLASADVGGKVALWDLHSYSDTETDSCVIAETLLAELQLEVSTDNVFPCLTWHPSQRNVLSVAASSVIILVNIGVLQKQMTEDSSIVVISKDDTNGIPKLKGLTKEDLNATVNSISFSPDGSLLAVATQDGNVHILKPFRDGQVLMPVAVTMVHDVASGGATMVSFIQNDVLFTAGDGNTELKLWTLNQDKEAAICTSEEQHCLQLISSKSSNFATVALPEAQAIVIADTSEGRMLCVRISGAKFYCIAAFSLKMPIASLSGLFDRSNHLVNLSCDQYEAFQQYSIPLALCDVKPKEENSDLEQNEGNPLENKSEDAVVDLSVKNGSEFNAEDAIEMNDTVIPKEVHVDNESKQLEAIQKDENVSAIADDAQTRSTANLSDPTISGLLTPQSLISPSAAANPEVQSSNLTCDPILQQIMKSFQKQMNLDQKKRVEQDSALAEKMKILPNEIAAKVRQQVDEATKSLSPKQRKPEKPLQPGAIEESVKKGVNAALPELEKLLAGKLPPALSNAVKETVAELVVPAFEAACKTMFDQVNTTFENGLREYIHEVQRVSQGAKSNEETAKSLLRSVEALKTVQDKMQSQLADVVQTLEGAASKITEPGESMSLDQIEEQLDPTVEIREILASKNYEMAFNKALSLGDLSVVTWICKEVPHETIFNSPSPTPVLSQGVILSLIQQLSHALSSDSLMKLAWIREAVMSLDPTDPVVRDHARTVLEQAYNHLTRRLSTQGLAGSIGRHTGAIYVKVADTATRVMKMDRNSDVCGWLYSYKHS